jgi:hypothetical protein
MWYLYLLIFNSSCIYLKFVLDRGNINNVKLSDHKADMSWSDEHWYSLTENIIFHDKKTLSDKTKDFLNKQCELQLRNIRNEMEKTMRGQLGF